MILDVSPPLWLQWTLSWAVVGAAVGLMLPVSNGTDRIVDLLVGIVFLALIGVPPGLVEFVILRRFIRHAWRWIPATSFGVLLGWFAGFAAGWLALWAVEAASLVRGSASFVVAGVVGGYAGGRVLGALQCPVLGIASDGPAGWPATSADAGLIAVSTFVVFSLLAPLPEAHLNNLVGFLLGSALFGSISGLSLQRSLPPRADETSRGGTRLR